MPLRAFLACLVIVWSINPAAADDEAAGAGHDFFENKIRPVLINRCFRCHAGEKHEGELRLDRRAFVLQGGQSGRVLLPGDPSGSLLIRAIRRGDKDLQMPPDDADKLTVDEIQIFVAWVKMGVPFPERAGDPAVAPVSDPAKARRFWSLQPPQSETPPKVEPQSWPRDGLDQFVLAKLQAAGMQPSVAADKHALLRRVTYDLTGLPPTPAEMDVFLADSSSGAFAKVEEIDDRLLLRWVRYLKMTVQQPDKDPHPIFAPWHALAAIPAAGFAAQAGVVIEKAKADKLNPHVAEMSWIT